MALPRSIPSKAVERLIRNFQDPIEVVRIASMRAALRLASAESAVSKELRDEILAQVIPKIPAYGADAIAGASFRPTPRVRAEIEQLLAPMDRIDRATARQIVEETAEKARQYLARQGDRGAVQRANLQLISLLAVPPQEVLHAGKDDPRRLLRLARPDLRRDLVTSQFARLAEPFYDEASEFRLVEAENVSRIVDLIGAGFQPDVPRLFQVYVSFFRASTEFWIEWLEEMSKQGHDPSQSLPPWFPLREGPLAVARQIEWTVSRAGSGYVLAGLEDVFTSYNPRDRWAGAQLLEGAVRYSGHGQYPVFGGGSGPEDILPPSLGLGSQPRAPAKEAPLPKSAQVRGVEESLPAAEARVTEADLQRYTDLTLFEGHLYQGDDRTAATTVPADQSLFCGSAYTLEVAIRLNRTGIDAEIQSPRAVKNPRRDRKVLKVYVLVEAIYPGIEIKEPFASLLWPYSSDSEPAFFRLEVLPASQSGPMENQIEVRLFDSALDLLDIVTLSVTAVRPAAASSQVAKPRKLTWPDPGRGEPDFNPSAPRRLLSIDLRLDPATARYKLLFKFLTASGNIAIPGSSQIATGDVENLLADVRDFWTELVITSYASKLTVTRSTYKSYLDGLRRLGIRAWHLLFGDGFAAQAGASETLADLLLGLRPMEKAHIQITYTGLDDFVFPWSIIYPPDASRDPDPFQFWGARYKLEQVRSGPKSDRLIEEPVRVVFALDPRFGNSELQKDLLASYAAAGSKLTVSPPVSTSDALFDWLLGNPSAHVYYFYCHGYAPAAKAVRRRDGIQLLRGKIQALPEGSEERAAWEALLGLTDKMLDEPWILMGDSEIKESQFRGQPFFQGRRPIVFLNMCQSADLVPSLTGGLVRLFLDHNASAVVGTECPMTAIFAHEFSRVIFQELFGGSDLGTALLAARCYFLSEDLRNPLGLAYTLYGRAIARLGATPILPVPKTLK